MSLREKCADRASDDGIAFIDGGITDVWVSHKCVNDAKKANYKELESSVYIGYDRHETLIR